MRRYLSASVILGFAALSVVGAQSLPHWAGVRVIRVSGSETLLPLVRAWADAYGQARRTIEVSVAGGGTSAGIADLLRGDADFAASSRALSTEETQLLTRNQISPDQRKVAIDAVAVIVNPGNPIATLSIPEIAALFSGTTINWQELGGSAVEVVPVTRDTRSGTRTYFRDAVLRSAGRDPNSDFAAHSVITKTQPAMNARVAASLGAVGYVGFSAVGERVRAISIQLEGARGLISATHETISDGRYPLTRSLYLVAMEPVPGDLRDFLSYCLSPEGQKIAESHGFLAAVIPPNQGSGK